MLIAHEPDYKVRRVELDNLIQHYLGTINPLASVNSQLWKRKVQQLQDVYALIETAMNSSFSLRDQLDEIQHEANQLRVRNESMNITFLEMDAKVNRATAELNEMMQQKSKISQQLSEASIQADEHYKQLLHKHDQLEEKHKDLTDTLVQANLQMDHLQSDMLLLKSENKTLQQEKEAVELDKHVLEEEMQKQQQAKPNEAPPLPPESKSKPKHAVAAKLDVKHASVQTMPVESKKDIEPIPVAKSRVPTPPNVEISQLAAVHLQSHPMSPEVAPFDHGNHDLVEEDYLQQQELKRKEPASIVSPFNKPPPIPISKSLEQANFGGTIAKSPKFSEKRGTKEPEQRLYTSLTTPQSILDKESSSLFKTQRKSKLLYHPDGDGNLIPNKSVKSQEFGGILPLLDVASPKKKNKNSKFLSKTLQPMDLQRAQTAMQ